MHREGSYRKQWQSSKHGQAIRLLEESQVTKDEVLDQNYEDYLLLLQERNRTIKKLHIKDPEQIELERKEQGFSLYLNGANTELIRRQKKRSQGAKHKSTSSANKSQKPKTAGERIKNEGLQLNLHSSQHQAQRSKTAPEKNQRKNWLAGSVDIKTHRGEKVKIKAPDILTGNYEDDFEEDLSYESSDQDSSSYESSSEGSDTQDMSHRGLKVSPGEAESDEDEDGYDSQLTLSIRDVKKLRQSLEMNSSIQQSLAKRNRDSNSDSDHESPIEEEDEEVEEEIIVGRGTSSGGRQGQVHNRSAQKAKPGNNRNTSVAKKSPNLKSDDVIVLEFAPPAKKGPRHEKQLTAARKKDADSYAAPRTPREERTSNQASKREELRIERSKEVVLKPGGPSKKSSRPLSANRKHQAEQLDPTDEAAAVIEAMKAENESLDIHRRDSRSAPGRSQHDDRSPLPSHEFSERDRPLSARQSASYKERLKSTHVSDKFGGTRDSWAVPARSYRASQEDLHTSNHIDSIVKKVLKLDSRGQRKLLRALRDIERTEDSETSAAQPSSPQKPVKATDPVNKMVKKKPSKSSTLYISLQIQSNWGHATRVGLTEIQFIDLQQQKIEVTHDNIQAVGARNQRSELTVLCNGKSKTVKDKHMWSCDKPTKKQPLGLMFTLHKPADYTGEFALSKIRIWNYNKSLIDLNMGVCDISIVVNNQVVYEGEVDKGCGNQVFNYAKDIILCDDISPRTTPPKETKSAPLRLDIAANDRENSDQQTSSTTPTVDNVALFGSIDTGRLAKSSRTSPPRSETRLLDHDDDSGLERPSINSSSPDADERSSDKPKSSKKPTESTGEPKSRRRKSKDGIRKSKMAARLDGSHSSVDSSMNSISASVDRYSIDRTNDPSDRYSVDKSNMVNGSLKKSSDLLASEEKPSKTSANTHKSSNKEVKTKDPEGNNMYKDMKSKKPGNSGPNTNGAIVSAIPGHLSVPDRGAMKGGKPGSPYFSDEDSGSMLDQIRKITKDKKQSKEELPSWLNKKDETGTSELSQAPKSQDSFQKKEENLLDNWPAVGVPHLHTVLDEGTEGQTTPLSGRKSRNTNSKNLGVPESESGRVTPNRMQEIEQKRAEWKKKEQFKLEESWTSLNLFDRSQKGRISLDLQKDVLDEYLTQEKIKPSQPTIAEEESSQEVALPVSSPDDDDDVFTIPELPVGKELVIDIKTTWGDHHYVGLNGIEIFTSSGEPATISKITADPLDINVLPEYSKDPRVVTNLIDGVNRTRDDTHMWLAPYNKDSRHRVFLTADKPISIAMMRIWNYNKSRIHSYRGVKDIEISLDGSCIFKGEITRACGGIVGGSEAFGETILFTMDEDILELVSQYDQAFEFDWVADVDSEEEEERPRTADESSESVARPYTSAARGRHPVPSLPSRTEQDSSSNTKVETSMDGDTLILKGQYLRLNLTSTWGDPYYLGLTGMELADRDGEAIPLNMSMLDADPRDLHILPGYERDDRTLDKLIDGVNITTCDEHMWLIPFTDGEDHVLAINLGKSTELSSIRFWNYNKSPEDTYRGAKIVHITLDDRQVSPPDGFLIRKGPGNCFFDFAQEVSFTEPMTPRTIVNKGNQIKPSDSLILDEPSQEYEVVQKPCGFIYQLQLLSTWGDPYYVGLNGLEFYDGQGNLIKLDENNISAYPESVNVLEGIENDTRTPDKLINGENDTNDGRHMWLAPVLPGMLNRVYVIFDSPMEISMIKIWNYSKTVNRGVKDFALLVDDLLVYNGLLDVAAAAGRGILPTCDGPQRYHTILFTDDKSIQRREKHTIIKNQAGEQDVQLMNDRKVMATYSDPQKTKTKPVDQAKRPTTSVPRGRAGRGNRR